MSEGSGVVFECPNCGYETVAFPESSEQKADWLSGFVELGDKPKCVECADREPELGELFSENGTDMKPMSPEREIA